MSLLVRTVPWGAAPRTTCPAAAGTLMLEFGYLSALTGKCKYLVRPARPPALLTAPACTSPAAVTHTWHPDAGWRLPFFTCATAPLCRRHCHTAAALQLAARRALDALWMRRSPLDLWGTVIDVLNGVLAGPPATNDGARGHPFVTGR